MARENGDATVHAEHKGGHESHRHQAQTDLRRGLMTTAAVIGVAALLEPELLVGMAIGAGAALASNWLPEVLTGAVNPLIKTAIKAGYTAAAAAREMVAEATESVQDMVAEARAERGPMH